MNLAVWAITPSLCDGKTKGKIFQDKHYIQEWIVGPTLSTHACSPFMEWTSLSWKRGPCLQQTTPLFITMPSNLHT